MAIAYKSQGSGVSTETNLAALSPLCPATVDAGDILIGHVYHEGTANAPSTPANWTLLSGPHVVETTIGRHWVFGKIADGTEDGAAVAFGTAGGTNQRGARIYSFSGRIGGTITDLVTGFAHLSHATDPQMPSVTTTRAGDRAVALTAQNDNNAQGNATGETGGDWTEATAAYLAALTPGIALAIQTAQPTANPGTISGGSVSTANDPVGVVGFQIRAAPAGYKGEVLLDAPSAYWRLGDDAGATADDATDNNRDGTYSNVTLNAADVIRASEGDGAADFNGTNARVTTTYDPWSGSITLEAWIKPDDIGATVNKAIIGATLHIQWLLVPTGISFFYSGFSAAQWFPTGDSAIVAGNKYHLVMTFTPSSTAELWINGVSQGAVAVAAYGSTPGNLQIGARSGAGAAWFDGVIDEVAVYPAILSSARIAAHYAAGKSVIYKGLTPASETDAGVALDYEIVAGAQTFDLTPAAESDAPATLDIDKHKTLSPATEADAGQVLDIDKHRTLSPATESDATVALDIDKRKTLSPAAEVDSPIALDVDKHVALSPAAEADAAQALSLAIPIRVTLTPAAETDTAIALALRKVVTLTPASELDVATSLGITKVIALTAAVESDAAQTLAISKRFTLVPANESDVGVPLAILKRLTLTPASESDTAVSRPAIKLLTLNPALEIDTAEALAVTKTIVKSLTPATEDDEAINVVIANRPTTLTPAEESDVAQALDIDKHATLTPANELDAAQALSVAHRYTLTSAEELDTAIPLDFDKTIRQTLIPALESDSALQLDIDKTIIVTLIPALEIDQAISPSVGGIHVTLIPATEIDTAATLVITFIDSHYGGIGDGSYAGVGAASYAVEDGEFTYGEATDESVREASYAS